MITTGSLHRGFEYPLIKFVVISEGDIFGAEKTKRRKKRKAVDGKNIQSFTDLNVGDYVVHENHGVGLFKGIEKITSDKVTKDYIKIGYRDGGNLYVPVNQLDLVQKYIGGTVNAKLSKLGGADWIKAKARARNFNDKGAGLRFVGIVRQTAGGKGVCLHEGYGLAKGI